MTQKCEAALQGVGQNEEHLEGTLNETAVYGYLISDLLQLFLIAIWPLLPSVYQKHTRWVLQDACPISYLLIGESPQDDIQCANFNAVLRADF